jgi:hypothetical protein
MASRRAPLSNSASTRYVWCVEVQTRSGTWQELPERCVSSEEANEVKLAYRDDGLLEYPDGRYTRLRAVKRRERVLDTSSACGHWQPPPAPEEIEAAHPQIILRICANCKTPLVWHQDRWGVVPRA